MKIKVIIEEHISGEFEVEAANIEEAMEIAADKYYTGELVVEPNCYPTARIMMAEDEYGIESTEWVEF